jgi:hypothetical protein
MYNKKLLKDIVGDLNKAKAPKKPNDIIVDPMGQWKHPGKVTRIPSNQITMQGVNYPVLGVPDKGKPTMMQPGQYYDFPEADYVDEYPQMAEGGDPGDCEPGYTKDAAGNCVPIRRRILVDSDQDPRYQDYLIRKSLYEHSSLPTMRQREFFSPSINPKYLFNKETDLKDEDFQKELTTNPMFSDDMLGYAGSKVNKSRLTPEEYQKMIASKDLEPINYYDRVTSKYAPIGYDVMDEYSDDFLANYYTYRTDEPKPGYGGRKLYIAPKTTPIEDEINRARLKEIYPLLTDAEIDKQFNEYRSDPSYVTNRIGSWGGREYVGPNQTYPEFNAPASYYDENKKLKGYLPDVIREDIDKYKRYIPVWGEPEEVYDVKFPKMEIKKPEPILTAKGELEGLPEKELPPDYNAPGYKKDYPAIYMRHHHSGQLIPHARPTLTSARKATPYSRIIQKVTGYDPAYMEGYTDEEGNYVPGEIEKAEQEGRRIEFKGRTGRQDKKAQEAYNKAYDEYENKKAQEEMYRRMLANGIMFPALGNSSEGEEEMKKGGSKKSKKYTRSILGTNYLFAESGLFNKPKKLSNKRIYSPHAKYYQEGGEKDKWGRPKGSKWYGFDPKTKKYTTKDEWGRSPDSQWYGFNPQNKSWTLANQNSKNNKIPKVKPYKIEEDIVDPLLGSPQKKAIKFAKGVDNIRHPMASYYTAKSLTPYLGTLGSMTATNLLGAAHEAKRIFDDPEDWSVKLRESGEDMFNNYVGSMLSVLPESWAKGTVKTLSDNNLLPDGVEWGDRNAYVKQDGGEAGCPEGYAFNPKTGECVEWNPDIRESYDQPTSFDPIGDVIYINPDDRPEGMSDQEYQDMYNDQIEHEQLHRMQWMNDDLKGQNQTPLRMPSTVDNQEYEGDHYYNRRGEEEAYLHDIWNQHNPEIARFIPEDVVYNNEINPVMYELPWTEEGEARGYEGALHRGMESLFPKKQNGGESDDYVYIDNLSPEEIEEYRKGGYIIEDISLPSLTKASYGHSVGNLIRKQNGGQTDYQLGDEVDEAAMKRLKKLGYTFEKL